MDDSLLTAVLGHLFEAARLGETVADLRCDDASVVIALARAGRIVTAFDASATAQAEIAVQLDEVRARITLAEQRQDHVPGMPFAAAFAGPVICELVEPAPFFERVRNRCRDRAPLIIGVPNHRAPCPQAVWIFSESTLRFALEPFGAADVHMTSNGRSLCARLGPRSVRACEPRITVLLRLTSEDRWVSGCLAQLASFAGLIVTLDDNIPDRSFDLVQAHRTVAHVRRREPFELSVADWSMGESLAASWMPHWTLRMASSELLAPGAIAGLQRALRDASTDVRDYILPTLMMWDRADQVRIDTDPAYELRPRLIRVNASGTRSLRLDLNVHDYTWFDADLRTARKVLALESMSEVALHDDWRFAAQPPVGALSIVRPAPTTELLLAAALAHVDATCQRALCVEPQSADAARVLSARWPGVAVTAIACAPLGDPYARPYDFMVQGDLSELDLRLFFASREYDLVIDFALLPASNWSARLTQLVGILHPHGRYIAIIDESVAELPFIDLLARRVLFDAGLRIDAVTSMVSSQGECFTVVVAQRRPQLAPKNLFTICVPLHTGAPNRDAYITELLRSCPEPGVQLVLVGNGADIGSIPLDAGALTTAVFEPGLDAVVAAAYDVAPCDIMCVVAWGTIPHPGWSATLCAAFAAQPIGLAALEGVQTFWNGSIADGPVLAVATRAVHPHAWPRGFTDDRLRAAVLAGMAARAGYASTVIPLGYHAAPARQEALAPRAAWEGARAMRAGFPGSQSALYADPKSASSFASELHTQL